MKKFSYIFWAILSAVSCKLPTDSSSKYAVGNAFHLQLNPNPGSSYYYDITNHSAIEMEVNNKTIENINKADVGITYSVEKDSSGSYRMQIAYGKLRVYSKNGDQEIEADAQNAGFSINPTEKMLGLVKNATLTAMVTPTGEVKEIGGYKELSAQLMANLATDNENARQLAQAQLDKIIGTEMIRKNLSQLFQIFPDSAIYIGDKWTIESAQQGDFNLKVRSTFHLDYVTDSIAFVKSQSKIEGDRTPLTMMGYTVIPDLSGTQVANYEIEIKTGMLLRSKIESEVTGKLNMAGQEIPINITVNVGIAGKRVR